MTTGLSIRVPSLPEWVRELREDKGWTQAQLAEKLGVTTSTLSKKERGEFAIKPPLRRKIAEVFGLTLEQFDAGWRAAKITRTVGGPGIPVINRASAGVVVDYEEWGIDSGQGFEYIDRGDIKDELAVALIIQGDSMEPTLREGDYVVFVPMGVPKPSVEPKPGMIVFVRFTPESGRQGGTVARWHPMGDGSMMTLTKDNPKYPPMSAINHEVEQMLVAIQRRSALY